MVTTRSKARTEDGGSNNDVPKQQSTKAASTAQQKAKNANTSRKRKEPASSGPTPTANQGKKRKDSVAEQQQQPHKSPALDEEQEQPAEEDGKTPSTKLHALLSTYAHPLPLASAAAGLSSPTSPTPTTVLAHIINALLSSTRISHDIASRTAAVLIRERYHDLPTLRATTWQQRTEALTEGGYTHYREKTATELGDLAALLDERYGGDASTLLPSDSSGEAARKELRGRLKVIKGFGDVGADIFIAAVQGLWPRVAPFLDRRSRETAEQIGLGKDVEALYEELGREPVKMAELNSGLTRVRLEKRIGELKG
ncbi:hypothetical protein GTA08_BOTSDO01938 [Botryosphaeria dothidea]|uniref:Uncharacterized protein n=1 Tax=Botryosphaeria dothidea TaxID=55169 RepID=A0A8H4IYP6_9PEZI|nr:hypothetical protein GTA08_BOTSDO01938 [Botryosphaeria dothidea]